MTERLGRGLSALIPKRATTPESGERISDIPVSAVRGNPYQPREKLEHGKLEELVDSVRQHGILEPLIVTRTGEGYELVVGHRRLAAAVLAGLPTVPAIIRSATNQQKLELALVENLQRHELNPLEEARAFQRLATEFDLTHAQIAERVGRSRTGVTNALRLLKLPEDIREAIAQGAVTAGHARAILAAESAHEQRKIFRKVVGDRLTVRGAERLSRVKTRRPSARPSPRVFAREAEALTRIFGTKVGIESDGRGGRVILTFYDPEDLDALIERLGGNIE
jgi:ParB family chromosome partitioning protein